MRTFSKHPAKRAGAWFVIIAALGVSVSAAVFAQSYYDRRGDERYERGASREERRLQYCRELEQTLVDEWRRANSSRDELPRINEEIRKLDHEFNRLQAEADRRQCYEEMFIFGRSLRRTPACVKLDREIKVVRRELRNLQERREAIRRPGLRKARQDDLIAELARYGCGEDYQRQYEARRRSRSFFSFWEDGDFFGPRRTEQPRQNPSELPFATYRTMCVRECDGYYFPISFSTLPSQFAADETKCHERCAAPSRLFVYRNPGEEVEQMVSLSGQPYSEMDFAWRYRKHFIEGCSCSVEEFSVAKIAESERKLSQPTEAKQDIREGGFRTESEPLPEKEDGMSSASPGERQGEKADQAGRETTSGETDEAEQSGKADRQPTPPEQSQARADDRPIITDLPAKPTRK